VSTFDFGAGLLVFAAVVGVVNDRTLRLPRPVALLLASLAISASIIGTAAIFGYIEMREHLRVRIIDAHLPQILLNGFLALLLFAGSLHVDARDLRRRAWHLSLCEIQAGNWGQALRLYRDALTLERHSGGPN
jgi:monovalent cation:H+ antiporter, CPA1 family